MSCYCFFIIIFDKYTNGLNKNNSILIGSLNNSANFSELRNAITLGSISPKINMTIEITIISKNIASISGHSYLLAILCVIN